MAFWRRRSTPTPAPEVARFGAVYIPPEMTQGGLTSPLAPRVARREAITVPAVKRARDMIAATLGGLPLHVHGPDRVIRPWSLLDQPERGIPRSVTMTRLFEDLLFEGIAWWRVVAIGWDGFPAFVERLDPSIVSVPGDGKVYVNGVHVPDAELIRFYSPNDALLCAGARAIRTLLKLDAAAARAADEPLPLMYFTPVEGADPANDEQVRGLLTDWKAARQQGATAYVPAALKANQVTPMTAEQMQLAESRQHAVLEIARLAGIDAEDLGVSTTSRTYFNAEDRRQSFLDLTLSHYGKAVEDRLTMPDVTPRGSYVKVSYEGFLRTDVMTRYQSYALGLQVGALVQDEIRPLEDKPDLTPGQRRTTPVPAPTPQTGAAVQQQSADPAGVTTFTAAGDVVSLAFSGDAVEFKADPEKRTVSGMLLPFNVQTSDGRSIRFAAGSVTWQKAAVSRIKLDREHDLGQLLGSATSVSANDNGVTAAFKVAKTAAGDEALALAADGALDGLSAVVRITDAIPDPANEGGSLVTAATLVRATLTADPAFDDARLSAVALTSEGISAMECTTCHKVHAAGTPCATPPADNTAAFTSAVESFTKAVEALGQGAGREAVPAGGAVGFSVTEPMVYQFNGRGHSLARDAFNAKVNGDSDAMARVAKFQRQVADVHDKVGQFVNRDERLTEFATINRTVGANVIPPGYRPDLYVPQLFQERPLWAMLSHGGLTDATSFTIPRFGSATGFSADHVEGTNPTDGTLAFGTSVTVTPGAISGLAKVTREMVDAANPAIDNIVVQAMQESWSQQTEGKVYTLLNGANGVGGTITSGQVPSGAYVVAATGVGSTGAAGVALLDTVRDQLVAYPFRRFASPDRLALSLEAAQQFAKAKDSTGRPLLPRIGATNAVGQVGTLDQSFDIDGLAGTPAWSMTGNAAGDADTILFNHADVWSWESPVAQFTYSERSGPAFIEFALFGYFGAAITRGTGFNGVRLTVT